MFIFFIIKIEIFNIISVYILFLFYLNITQAIEIYQVLIFEILFK